MRLHTTASSNDEHPLNFSFGNTSNSSYLNPNIIINTTHAMPNQDYNG